MIPLAHGIGGVRDLPVPESFFFVTAAIVLVVSFVLLGVLWRQPLLERHREGRRLPRALQVILLSARAARRLRPRVRWAPRSHPDDRPARDHAGAPELGADVRLRDLLARAPAPVRGPRRRLARAQPVAGDRGRDGMGDRADRPGCSPSPRLTLALWPLSGRHRAVRVRRTRARTSEAVVSAHAWGGDRALQLLGARRDGRLRP